MFGNQLDPRHASPAVIEALIADPAGHIEAPAIILLAPIDPVQVTQIINRTIGDPPRRASHIVPTLVGLLAGGPAMATLGGTISFNLDVLSYNKRMKAVSAILSETLLRRPTVGLTPTEKVVLVAMAKIHAAGHLSSEAWFVFLSRLTWNAGNCILERPARWRDHKHIPLADDALRSILGTTQPAHSVMLEEAANHIAGTGLPAIAAELTPGARWMTTDDLKASRVYVTSPRHDALVLGFAANGRPVQFAGNESLITIGGPGTGKTQAQVLPNLLNYPGSAFVLDVKDELWRLTAGRRTEFGPVYRFAPTDPTGSTHAYNPFDMIARDADQAAIDCQTLAYQLILEKPDLKDPYWENRGRDYLWTFALAIALANAPKDRTLQQLAAQLSLPLSFNDLSSPAYKASPTAKAIVLLRTLATKTGIVDLANNATALETALTTESTRLESVFDTARRHVAVFARSAHVRRATARSDWHPLDLRRRPGTTVYFCLKPGELQAFAPLVRILFQQHAAALTKDFSGNPGNLPITFFLDEMPQLGNLASLNDLLDVGRSAGLRLWMFAQYLGQIRAIYGKRANGLINACQIRCFLQPDNEAAEFIAPALGKTRSLFRGDERPLAEPHDLMGRAYSDQIISLARGEHPMVLAKLLAHQHYGHWMRIKAPAVGQPIQASP